MRNLPQFVSSYASKTLFALVLVLSMGTAATTAAGSVGQTGAKEDGNGLGEYGPTGSIDRALLPSELAEIISDDALEMAQAPELAAARESWNVNLDYVFQVHYQLTFRGQTDYLSTESGHLGRVLESRPQNIGVQELKLYLTDVEAAEMQRRLELGDRIPEVVRAIGEQDPDAIAEGQDPRYSANFGGVWQDQMDEGAIVVALVDTSKIDRERLAQIVGGDDKLRLVQVAHSWDEINDFRDTLLASAAAKGVVVDVLINSTGVGRRLEIVTSDPDLIDREVLGAVPAELVAVTRGSTSSESGSPRSTHSESNQQPGLAIEFDPGGWCTWGVNGHTSSYNYLVTAGHCGGGTYDDYSGWTSSLNIHQNNSFHLTPGSQYVYSKNTSGWDMKRMTSPQADSNGYHAGADWEIPIRYRALHNSWEVNSDMVCMSMGANNYYNCGYVVEENYTSTGSGCEGSRWMRYSIGTIPGDSGAGLIGFLGQSYTSIDAIQACNGGGNSYGFGNTAYDVKNQLGFDYNCASSLTNHTSAGSWGSCPTLNR